MIWWCNVKKGRYSNHEYIYDKKTKSQTLEQYLINFVWIVNQLMRIFIPKKFLSTEDTKLEQIQDLKFYLDGSKFFWWEIKQTNEIKQAVN